jgi:hypothetical protein
MTFLDELIDPIYSYQGDLTEQTTRRLNYMVSMSLLYSEEKEWYEMNIYKMSEEEAKEHIIKLQDFMPIMGLHSWPHSVVEQNEAIQYQVAKDNLHEQRFGL